MLVISQMVFTAFFIFLQQWPTPDIWAMFIPIDHFTVVVEIVKNKLHAIEAEVDWQEPWNGLLSDKEIP